MSKASILTIILSGIVALIVALAGFIIKDYMTTPKPIPLINDVCNAELKIEFSNIISYNVNNIGLAPALFKRCIFSNEFSINGLKGREICYPWNELQHKTNPQEWIILPTIWNLTLTKEQLINLNNLTITHSVYCKQKIWFLERDCEPFLQTCNYMRKKDFYGDSFKLIYKS